MQSWLELGLVWLGKGWPKRTRLNAETVVWERWLERGQPGW